MSPETENLIERLRAARQQQKAEPPQPVSLRIFASRMRDNEPFAMPAKAHGDDAGIDFVVSRTVVIDAGGRAMIPSNVAVAVPRGWFGLVLPRSSTFYRKGLIVHPGVIDAGYRGEVMVLAYNPSDQRRQVTKGERIAQMIVLPVQQTEFVEQPLAALCATGDRGAAGFGSSGGFDEEVKR